MNLSLLSALLLGVVILLNFFKKVNIGFLAILFAYPLGKLGGLSDNEIISGFNTNLFVTLMGVTLLFSITQENKTLPFLTHRAVRLIGKRAYLLPFVIFLCAAVLSAIGPGPIPVMSMMNTLAVAIAWELNCSPILLVAMSVLGASAGATTPITSTGIVIYSLAQEYEIPHAVFDIFSNVAFRETLCAVFLYIILQGHRLRGTVQVKSDDLDKVSKEQLVTMSGIAVMLLILLVFRLNIGLCSFALSVVLLLFHPMPSAKLFISIPWDTLVMIGGMNLYMNVMIKLGGIDLLSHWLAGFMTPVNATAIVAVTAGVMSWFSSTTGVVLPTMIPMVPKLTASLVGIIPPSSFITAITATAMVAGISPLSTGGGLALASYSTKKEVTEKECRTLMLKFFLTSATLMMFLVLLEIVISVFR